MIIDNEKSWKLTLINAHRHLYICPDQRVPEWKILDCRFANAKLTHMNNFYLHRTPGTHYKNFKRTNTTKITRKVKKLLYVI